MTKNFHEPDILAPRDPSLDLNTDAWPEFDLHNVSVHVPDDPDTSISLLSATEHYPLTVRGQVQLTDESTHLLVQPIKKKIFNIEISDVKTFSYGQYTNGAVALWAAGRSGWYTIRPSRSYKRIFHEMTDAVNIFYFIVDAYRDVRKTGKGRSATTLPPYSAQEVFEKYATDVLEEPSDVAEAADRFYQHRDFILSSMVAGKEGISWSHNPLFIHLSRKFSSDYVRIKRRVKGTRMRSADGQKPTRLGSIETNSTSSSLKRKRRQASVPDAKVLDVIELESSSDTETGAAAETKDSPDGPRSSHQRPAESAGGRRTRQTPSIQAQMDTDAIPTKSDDSEGESVEQVPAPHRKRKSLLRLRPSSASKSITRSGKAPARDTEADAEESSVSPPADHRNSKPPRGTSRPPSKRRVSGTHVDEGIDMADSHSDDNDHAATSPTADEIATQREFGALPLRSLDHRPDSVQEDTWICALDGCSHKVFAASNPESQKLIREHYALHAYDDDSRVQLVKRLQAPSLPVSHLMERVRQQAKIEGFPGSRVAGTRYPDAVPAAPSLSVAQRY